MHKYNLPGVNTYLNNIKVINENYKEKIANAKFNLFNEYEELNFDKEAGLGTAVAKGVGLGAKVLGKGTRALGKWMGGTRNGTNFASKMVRGGQGMRRYGTGLHTAAGLQGNQAAFNAAKTTAQNTALKAQQASNTVAAGRAAGGAAGQANSLASSAATNLANDAQAAQKAMVSANKAVNNSQYANNAMNAMNGGKGSRMLNMANKFDNSGFGKAINAAGAHVGRNAMTYAMIAPAALGGLAATSGGGGGADANNKAPQGGYPPPGGGYPPPGGAYNNYPPGGGYGQY